MNFISGLLGGNAANRGYNEGMGALTDYFNKAQGYLQPYREFGTSVSLPGLQNFISGGGMNMPTAETVSSLPGYQFNFNQGLNALQNSALNKGGLLSGNAMKAITQYGQDYAGSQWKDYMNQNTQLLNNWLNTVGIGQNAASGSASNAMNTGSNLMNSMIGQGQSNAQYQLLPFQLAAGVYGMGVGSNAGNMNPMNWKW